MWVSFLLKKTTATLKWSHRESNLEHTHTYTHKAKPPAAILMQLLLPSEPILGCLCTTQAPKLCAGKSSWGRASNSQEDNPSLTERSRGSQSSTTTSTPLIKTRNLLSQVPTSITAGWDVSLVGTRSRDLHLTAAAKWVKFFAQGNSSNTKAA